MDDKDIGVKEFGRSKNPEATATPIGRSAKVQQTPQTQHADPDSEMKKDIIRGKIDDEIENEGRKSKEVSRSTQNKSHSEGKNSIMQKKMGKRSFIKIAAGFVGALFTGKKAGDQLNSGEEELHTQAKSEESNHATEEVQNVSYTENDVKEQEVDPPTDSENEKTKSFEEILFPNFSEYTDDEQYFLIKSIEDGREFYIEKNTKASVENIASDILVRREQINQICDEEGIEENSFLREALLGMIFVESKNNPNRENDVSGAIGLLQILPSTAEGYGVTKEELWDEETNMRLAVKYMKYLYDLFPDPGLAVWAYHAGQGNMAYLIGNYMKPPEYKFDTEKDKEEEFYETYMNRIEVYRQIEEKNEEIKAEEDEKNKEGNTEEREKTEKEKIEEMLSKESEERVNYAREFITEKEIDFKKLIRAKDITNIVETEMHDESEKYTFRVGAALSFIEDVKEV